VALKQPPSIDRLQQIDQVEQVEIIDDNRFRLSFDSDSIAQSIVRASIEQDWGLYELVPDHTSLEDLFIELTQDEATDLENAEAEA
jgi:ABC-2 type transport system ATP-binding protein